MIMQLNEQLQIGRIKKIGDGTVTLHTDLIHAKAKRINVLNLEGTATGDIVSISQEGRLHILWRAHSKDNLIFTTNVCNEKCLFCPQSEEGDAFSNASINNKLLSNLHRSDIDFVTITGGEPTLIGVELPKIIHAILSKNRKASIAILSNGMEFDNEAYANEVVKAGKSQTRICIAVHSDVPSIHDSITGVAGSFDRTVLGLLNLQRAGADIEIRVVLNRLNADRLPNIASSIRMNFPFVSHVAFMGLEVYANAAANAGSIWINPPEYMEKLALAIYCLHCSRISTSIYNLPYCLVPISLWTYLRDSISGWKKTFLPLCESCSMKIDCPGLFETSLFQSPSIAPIALRKADHS